VTAKHDAFLTEAHLADLIADLLGAGVEVWGPARVAPGAPRGASVDGALAYRPLAAPEQLTLSGLTRRSLKEAFLPPSEPLLRYRESQSGIALDEVRTTFAPRVVLGARPCDAAGLAALDAVMGWDYRDELWFGRREATTIVSLACTEPADHACFCTAVGLGPESGRGADVLLRRAPGGFLAEAQSERGATLVAAHEARFVPAPAGLAPTPSDARERVAASVPFAASALAGWLEAHFDDPRWEELALRCHGCGACASVCPTCHCFDIVDEREGRHRGTRRRNWDTCQASLFTLHGSGHNPRPQQGARMRQRILHKLSIYPRRFGTLLCTGCGRCARACPGGMDLPEVLRTLGAAAGVSP